MGSRKCEGLAGGGGVMWKVHGMLGYELKGVAGYEKSRDLSGVASPGGMST